MFKIGTNSLNTQWSDLQSIYINLGVRNSQSP